MACRMPREINVDDERDRWRWVCPNGHRSWEPTNYHFWCQKCARHRESDGVFQELEDKKTGETYERDEIRLLVNVGEKVAPYEEVP